MARRQRGPQAQLVGIATQVAVSPFAPDADVPASLSARRATGDRTQTDRNLFKSRLVRNGEQSLWPVFSVRLCHHSEKRHGLRQQAALGGLLKENVRLGRKFLSTSLIFTPIF